MVENEFVSSDDVVVSKDPEGSILVVIFAELDLMFFCEFVEHVGEVLVNSSIGNDLELAFFDLWSELGENGPYLFFVGAKPSCGDS